MNRPRKKPRAAVRLLLGLTAFAGVGLALLPVWFPWLLQPVLRHCAICFQDYERLGYTRFALVGVHGTWRQTEVDVERVESPLPTAWLWWRLTGKTNAQPWLAASDWRLTMAASTNRSEQTRTPIGVILDQAGHIGDLLRRVLPPAHLTNGVLRVGTVRSAVPGVTWREGSLRATLQLEAFPELIEVAVRTEHPTALALSASSEAHQAGVRARLTHAPNSWQLAGEVVWRTNRADLLVEFDFQSPWPAQGQLRGSDVRIPAEWLALEGYGDLSAVFELNLASNRYALQATAVAAPADPAHESGWPEVTAELQVTGDPDTASVDRLQIRAPWLEARLTNRLGFTTSGRLLANAAQMQVALDLAGLPGLDLAGRTTANVRVELDRLRRPVVQFDILAINPAWRALDAERLSATGQLDWPVLRLNQLDAVFADGSQFTTSGQVDFATRVVADAQWRFEGDLIQNSFAGFQYDQLVASGEFGGPITNLLHKGNVRARRAHSAKMKPLDLRAAWQGRGLEFREASLELKAQESTLALQGSLQLSTKGSTRVDALLQSAHLRRGDEAPLTLRQPCSVRYTSGPAEKADAGRPGWSLFMDNLELRSGERELSLAADLEWPAHGKARLRARQLSSQDVADFWLTSFGELRVAELDCEAQWSNGPIHSVTRFAAGLAGTQTRPLTVNASIRSGEELSIEQSEVEAEGAPAVTVKGTLPIAFLPGRAGGFLRRDDAQPLSVRAEANTVSAFVLELGRAGRMSVVQPQLALVVGGTMPKPSVSLEARFARCTWQSLTNSRPDTRLDELSLHAVARSNALELTHFTARLDGQPLRAQGECPLPADFWKQITSSERTLPDWRQSRGRLQIEKAQAAALARYLPALLAPEGRLSADLTLLPGWKLEGLLALTNAATRPLGSLSPLRDIAARVRVAGDTATLEEFRGQIGGQPVRANGKAALLPEGGLDYRLRLLGSNVPLARSVEFLLRGDLNLELNGTPAAPPLVSGEVVLRDGLFVQSATALVLSRPERPELRPPYFCVTNQPFADWKLDLVIRGDRFLRVRMPVFNGLMSANLKLRGTLREPVATGDLRADSGRVLFPFGALQVSQAYASLDGNDPRGPDLLVHASGRTLRYDVRLEVTGPADGANVVFSSTPPLNSEEIVLMLTAGELPRDENVFSTQARAGRLATFFGRDFLSRFTGDDMAGERFIVNTGENLTEEGKATYSIEYRLTDRWSLLGEYDRFNALNTAVKWRILSR